MKGNFIVVFCSLSPVNGQNLEVLTSTLRISLGPNKKFLFFTQDSNIFNYT